MEKVGIKNSILNFNLKCSLITQRAFFLVLFLNLFLISNGVAQELELQRIKSQFQIKPTFDLRMDTRNSFITNRVAKIKSAKVGLDYNNVIKVGIGLNILTSKLQRRLNSIDTQLSRLKFWYISPYLEYNFYHTKRIDISIPVNFGIGKIGYTNINKVFTTITSISTLAFVYEPYLIGNYKLLPTLALGAGIGYRISVFNNNVINQQLSSPIYIFKTQFYLSEIMNGLKKID
jgi:hypothetical protein